jgi:hypothetical protein
MHENGSDSNRVIAAVRIRPRSAVEVADDRRVVVSLGQRDGDLTILNPRFYLSKAQSEEERKLNERTFLYDYSFWSVNKQDPKFYDQQQIYEKIGRPIVLSALEGLNCSLFAYGQTGSGKTYTMMGNIHDNDAGVIPRLCKELLHEIYKYQAGAMSPGRAKSKVMTPKTPEESPKQRRLKAEVHVGYYEVYNESIFDLLAETPGTKCRVREHPVEGAFVDGLVMRAVRAYADVQSVLEEGHSKRQVAATLMNAESSRSHAVFTVFIQQQLEIQVPGKAAAAAAAAPLCEGGAEAPGVACEYMTVTRKSKVCLIDLAGSERLNSTGATGDRLKEATNINMSLSMLGEVIKALSESGDADEKFVPYRNSTLTWVLKDSLGGNSKTTMLATISPIDASYAESMNTLRYVERAKLIVSKAVVNDDNSNNPYVKHLQQQLALYKSKLSAALAKMRQRETEFQTHVEQLEKANSDMRPASLSSGSGASIQVSGFDYAASNGQVRKSHMFGDKY